MDIPRFFVELPLAAGAELALPATAARHAQVLRLQPGQAVMLFDGRGGQWPATIAGMTRKDVTVTLGQHEPVEREAALQVHLAVGLFALDRMDWLVEKATELGAASLTPVHTGRSNVALARAQARLDRWRALSARACEQCGRNRLLQLHPPLRWPDFLAQPHAPLRCMLAPGTGDAPMAYHGGSPQAGREATVLSGPEGGLTGAEQEAARAHGFIAVNLGPRILRAETAPLALLTLLLLAGTDSPT